MTYHQDRSFFLCLQFREREHLIGHITSVVSRVSLRPEFESVMTLTLQQWLLVGFISFVVVNVLMMSIGGSPSVWVETKAGFIMMILWFLSGPCFMIVIFLILLSIPDD